MAKQSSSSEFVSVNLNKLYGQTSSLSVSSSSFPSSGSNRPRSSSSRNGNMVSLSRPSVRSQTQTSSRVSKLAVPRPVNLPSMRKEHARNDPSVTIVGVSSSSFSGWTKQHASTGNAAVPSADSGKIRSSSETKWNNTRLSSPGDTTTSMDERNSTVEGINGRKPIAEAAIVVRCDEFPTLQATTKLPSTTFREKQKHDVKDHHVEQYGIEGRIQRLQLQPAQTTREDQVLNHSLKHQRSSLDRSYNEIRERSDDLRSNRIPGPSPLIRLSHTSDWADDERETLDSVRPEKMGAHSDRAEIGGLKNGYKNSDGLPIRNSRESKFLKQSERNVEDLGTEPLPNIGAPTRSLSWNGQPKREWGGSSAWRESKMGSLVRSSFNYGKHVDLSMQDNARKDSLSSSGVDDLQERRVRKNPGWPRNHLSNSTRITHSHAGSSHDLSGLDYGREKRTSGLYKQDTTSLKTSSILGVESFLAIPSSDTKTLRKKKDETLNYHDPVRELFEAELERVQLLQEQERQRLVMEQERAIELVKKRAEEQERIAREEEMLRLKKEQEVREETARAHKEAEEAARKVDEIRKAKEEQKQRMLLEDERRKEAARKKLLDLEERIAKREALQQTVSAVDEKLKTKGTIVATGFLEDKELSSMFSTAENHNEFVLTDSREEQTVKMASLSQDLESSMLLDSDNRKYPPHMQSSKVSNVRSKHGADEANHLTTASSKVHPSDEDALPYKVLPEFNPTRELSHSSMLIQQEGNQQWQCFQDEGFNDGQIDAEILWSRDVFNGLQRYSFSSLSTANDLGSGGTDYPGKGRHRQSLPKQPRVPLPAFGRSAAPKRNLCSDVVSSKDINGMNENVNTEIAGPQTLESSGPGLSPEVSLLPDAKKEISDGTAENVSTGDFESFEGDGMHAVEDGSMSEEAEQTESAEKLENEVLLKSTLVQEEKPAVEDDEDWLIEAECNEECVKDQNISMDGSGYQDWESIKVSYEQDKQHENNVNEAPLEPDLKAQRVEESGKENGDSTELQVCSGNKALGESKDENLSVDCYIVPNPTFLQQTCSMSTANIPHDFLHLGPSEGLVHNQSFLQQYQHPCPSERSVHSQSFFQQFQQPFSFMAVPLPHSTTVNGGVSNQSLLPSIQDIPSQQELPYHLHQPVVPNAIQIGSIQMPLHLHPNMPQLPHLHRHQSPMFQFGQICHSVPLSQPLQQIQTSSGQLHDRIDRSTGVDGTLIHEGNEQPGIETQIDKDNIADVSKIMPLNGGASLVSPTLLMTYKEQLMGKPSLTQPMIERNKASEKHTGLPSSGQGHLSPSSKHEGNTVGGAAIVPTAWSVKPSNEVVCFSHNQLEQGVKSFEFDTLSLQSGPTHENVPTTMDASISHGSILVPQKSATSVSMPGPLSSLLAGEKIQFGAVTSPTVLPSCVRASTPSIIGTIGPPSNASTDCPNNSLVLDKSGGPFASNKVGRPGEDEVCQDLADAEAAASAVAVAAISNDERVGNTSNADGSSHSSTTRDTFMSYNKSGETSTAVIHESNGSPVIGDAMSVALPSDLSVDTTTFNHVPMSSGAGISGYMLQSMQSMSSPFPCLEMRSILGGPPMFGLCPHEAASIVPLEPAVTPIGQWQDRQIPSDSYYGAPSTFIGPSAVPSIQGHPHMLVYTNPYAPVGQFGVNFMGSAYHPSGKQPDWSHTPFTSPIGTLSMNGGDIHPPLEPNHNGGAPNSVPVVGSSMIPIPTPISLFDPNLSIPFQGQEGNFDHRGVPCMNGFLYK